MATRKKKTPKRYGIYRALVTDNADPARLGRVRVRLAAGIVPSLMMVEVWAPVATLFAGSQSGSWFIPNVGDVVVVSFEAGDVRHPYVLGALWGPAALPPETIPATGQNSRRVLRSPSGLQISFDDRAGQEQLEITAPTGPTIRLRSGLGQIEITDARGNEITLGAEGVTLNSQALVRINAATLMLGAASVTVDAGAAKFSGVVQCDTLIANNVVASSYSPGAGNIL
jgi:uncharacterized protein involved in type VI secretion and phage assembly